MKPHEFVNYGLGCLEKLAELGDSCAKETREKLRVVVRIQADEYAQFHVYATNICAVLIFHFICSADGINQKRVVISGSLVISAALFWSLFMWIYNISCLCSFLYTYEDIVVNSHE